MPLATLPAPLYDVRGSGAAQGKQRLIRRIIALQRLAVEELATTVRRCLR